MFFARGSQRTEHFPGWLCLTFFFVFSATFACAAAAFARNSGLDIAAFIRARAFSRCSGRRSASAAAFFRLASISGSSRNLRIHFAPVARNFALPSSVFDHLRHASRAFARYTGSVNSRPASGRFDPKSGVLTGAALLNVLNPRRRYVFKIACSIAVKSSTD